MFFVQDWGNKAKRKRFPVPCLCRKSAGLRQKMKFQITFFRNQEMSFFLVLYFDTCGSKVQVPDLEVRWILLLKIEEERITDHRIFLQDYKEFLVQSILQSQVYKEDRPEFQRASRFQGF